jgi:imidazolonepropionase-like amidohydrolase
MKGRRKKEEGRRQKERKMREWKPMGLIVAGSACIVVGIASAQPGTTRATTMTKAADAVTVFRDVRVFDGEAIIERTTVVVRDGRIADVGSAVRVPEGATVVDGAWHTLLPGLIDTHVHTFGPALERALVFGVTTVIDMFTDHRQAAEWRREQRAGDVPHRADIVSAGTLVTAPKGHGTQYGLPIPTIEAPDEAPAFVNERLAEGSDFIKIVFDDGQAHGGDRSTLDEATLRAVIRAARARDARVVVHVSSQAAAQAALAAGAHGLVHSPADAPPTPDLVALANKAGAFVIPTLAVIESVTGTPGSAALLAVDTLAPYFMPTERAELEATFAANPRSRMRLPHALETTRQLHAAGTPILAGSDAPNPGTMHGATLHRELELLVAAGLTPTDALRAATLTAARAFGLDDRGRIAPGLRADLVLVAGNPAQDITATRRIAGVWKAGARLDRRPAPSAADLTRTIESGEISNFDGSSVTAGFGAGWQISTDAMMGGASEARMQIVAPGADGSVGALEVSGMLKAGSPAAWAGAMFFPGPSQMAPANLSRFKEVVFAARGDGRAYVVMLFASRLGQQPAVRTFTAGAEWQEVAIPWADFHASLDGTDVTGILFSASEPGTFRFAIDDVRLR